MTSSRTRKEHGSCSTHRRQFWSTFPIQQRGGTFSSANSSGGACPTCSRLRSGKASRASARNRDANWDRFRARVRDGHEIATDGWAEFHNPGSPPTWYYVKPAQAAGMPKDFDSLTCNSFDQCSAGACIRSVQFGYAFSRRDLPRAEWDKVVEGAREVWRTIRR